jgi:hypothetical protein
MAKQLSYAHVAERKRKAEQFLRDVKDDPERADEVSDESVEHYAARRHFDIIGNPRRVNGMANGSQTKQELVDQIAQLEQENQDLQDALGAVYDIVAPPDDSDMDDSHVDDGDDQD